MREELRRYLEGIGRPTACPCGRDWTRYEVDADLGRQTYEVYLGSPYIAATSRRVRLGCEAGCEYEFDERPRLAYVGPAQPRAPARTPWE